MIQIANYFPSILIILIVKVFFDFEIILLKLKKRAF